MRERYLADNVPGDLIEDVYVLNGKQFSPTTSGKHCIKAFISDRTSQVTARYWNATRELFNALPEAGFVRIRARIENYQGNLQCIVEQFWPPRDGTFDASDLLPTTSKDIPTMFARIRELLDSVQNRYLSALLQAFIDDSDLMRNFCRAPAAQSFHHAYVGGLLEHTLNAIEVAEVVCPFYPGLNRDLVLTGIFLHDIAKTWELSYECAFGYTDGGQLIGHIVKSAIWVEQKRAAAEALLGEKIPDAMINVVQHIILSHHDKPEFGSPKTPATPEAIAVHMIENLDAKMMMSLSLTRGEPSRGLEGNWSEYHKAFGGRLYRPDVAAADADPDPDFAPEADVKIRSESAESHGVEKTEARGEVAVANEAGPLSLKITNPLFEQVPARRK